MTEEFRTLSIGPFGGADYALGSPTGGGEEFRTPSISPFSGDDHVLGGPIPGAGGVIGLRYLMRGIDAAGPFPSYHYWSVDDTPDVTGLQAGTLPFGGPLQDIVVAGTSSCP